jgi:hypothetical protein
MFLHAFLLSPSNDRRVSWDCLQGRRGLRPATAQGCHWSNRFATGDGISTIGAFSPVGLPFRLDCSRLIQRGINRNCRLGKQREGCARSRDSDHNRNPERLV